MPPKKRQSRTSSKAELDSTPKKKVKTEIDYSLNQDIASWLRIDSIRSIHVTKSGHPTSCSSIADIMSVLFFHQNGLKFHADKPSHFLNDRFVLSKGHAAPILYSCLYRAKIVTQEQLMSLRLKGALLEGHPVPKIPFVDVATGSLGQGLSVAAGMAYSSKYLDKIDNRVFCICGDGQIAEGSIWEAANFACKYQLSNLITFIDVNRLGQSQQTMFEHDMKGYEKKFSSFGWETIVINGHNIDEIINALAIAKKSKKKPVAILAQTFKGKYFGQIIENKLDWHGKDLGEYTEKVIDQLKSTIKIDPIEWKTFAPEGDQPIKQLGEVAIIPNYPQGTKISTRKAYGNGLLKARQSNPNIVGLDGDTKNSTFAITLMNKYPESFVQCWIAEQNLIGVGTGISCRKKIPFCSTFSAFLQRAADQIRIAGIGHNNIKYVGSHSGCSIGEDGPSQMALEDVALFRTIPQGVVLLPSDGYSAQKAVQLAANYIGPVFIRTSRPDVNVIYSGQNQFSLGKSLLVKNSSEDKMVIISAGVTLHESIKAYQKLSQQGSKIRIIDIFSLKPLGKEFIKQNIEECHGKVLVVQEHYPQGGIGDAVCNAGVGAIKHFEHLCVRNVPSSAKPNEQLQIHGLDSAAIIAKVKQMIA